MAPASTGRSWASFVFDNLFVALAQLLTRLRGLVLLPLLVKGLGTETYGIYVQVISFVALSAGLFALNLHLPFIQFVAEDRARGARSLTTLFFSMLLFTVLGSAVLALVTSTWARDALVGTSSRPIFLAALGLVITTSGRTFLFNAYRATDRIKLRSSLDFGSTLIELLGAVALVAFGFGLLEVLVFTVGWGLLFNAAILAHVARLLGLGRFDRSLFGRAIAYSLPLIPAVLASWVLERASRFLLNWFHDERAVGIFSAHYALASLAGSLIFPLQVTLVPKIAQLWDSNRESARVYLESSSKVFVALALPFVGLCTAAAPSILAVLANQEIAMNSRASCALVGLGTALWGVSVIQSLVFYSTHETSKVALGTATAAAVNVAASVALIPTLGTLGAALATFVGYCAAAVAMAVLARRAMPLRQDLGFFFRCAAATGAASLVAYAAVRMDHPAWGVVLGGGLYVAAMSFVGGFSLRRLRALAEQAGALRSRS